jgi:gamma-glutamyltranspeptidase
LPTPSANPRFGQADVEQLLSDVFVASRRSLIHMDRAIPTPTAGSLRGNTTYFTVVDKDRNAVSFITDASRVRVLGGNRISLESTFALDVID